MTNKTKSLIKAFAYFVIIQVGFGIFWGRDEWWSLFGAIAPFTLGWLIADNYIKTRLLDKILKVLDERCNFIKEVGAELKELLNRIIKL